MSKHAAEELKQDPADLLPNIALLNSLSDSTESVDKNTLSLNYHNKNEYALKSGDFFTESEYNMLTQSDGRVDLANELCFSKAFGSYNGEV